MKNRRINLCACVVGCGSIVLATAASAEVIHLKPASGPSHQIQDAIDAAQDGDTIQLGAGIWIWGVDFEGIDLRGKAITLEGEGVDSTVMSLALKPEDIPAIVFQSDESTSTVVRDLSFDGLFEETGNIVVINNAHPAIESCTFRAFEGVLHPAIDIVNGGVDMYGCAFIENWMGQSAIISALDSQLTIAESEFIDCGQYGSIKAVGSYVDISETQFERTELGFRTRMTAIELVDCCGSVIDCAFQRLAVIPSYWENAAIAVYTINSSNEEICLNILNCTFDQLESTNQASAIGSSVPIVVAGCSFTDCDASGASGGAVNLFRGGVVAGCAFTDCYGYHGGGIGAAGDTIVWGCTFTDNIANKGGGVLGIRDRLFLLDCQFVGNTAQIGSAVFASLNTEETEEGTVPVAMYGCDFQQNQSLEKSGAIGFGYAIGHAVVEHCTFSGNLGPNGNPEAFSYPDEDEDWERYEIFVGDTIFCPSITTSRHYMTDLGGNLVDIKCPGESVNSILFAVDGRPFGWFWYDVFGWLQRQMGKNAIQLFDPETGGMQTYFKTGSDWAVEPRIDACARLDQRRLLLSFSSNGQPDDLIDAPAGAVTGADILLFTATEFGTNIQGSWTFYFDGSDVGLSGTRGNIDALAIEPDGSLLISVQGSIQLEGVGSVDDADVLRFRPTSLGSDTQGTWERVFGPAYSRFTSSGEDIDALSISSINNDWVSFIFSSTGRFSVDGVAADDEDVLGYIWYPDFEEAPTVGSVFLKYDGLEQLLFDIRRADITALESVGDW